MVLYHGCTFGCIARLHGQGLAVRFTSTYRLTRPSAPPYNTTDDSPVRHGHRFMRPRRLTTWRTTCSAAPAYNAGPTHLSAPTVNSAVINFSITVVTINSTADNFRPSTSGDIHLKYILLAHIIFVKEQFTCALVCNIVYAGQLFIAKAMVVSGMYKLAQPL